MDQIIARNTWEKVISGKEFGEGKNLRLTVKAELIKREENSIAYYSITGTIEKMDKRFRDPIVTCGAIHEHILKHFPELSPLVEVHLSEADGMPMHCEANARYWAGFSTFSDARPMSPRDAFGRIEIETDANGLEWSPKTLASHLQTDEQTARNARKGLAMGLPWYRITNDLGLIELWNKQASKARALLVESKQVANA
jgi:hypothetical protein